METEKWVYVVRVHLFDLERNKPCMDEFEMGATQEIEVREWTRKTYTEKGYEVRKIEIYLG